MNKYEEKTQKSRLNAEENVKRLSELLIKSPTAAIIKELSEWEYKLETIKNRGKRFKENIKCRTIENNLFRKY